MSGPIDRRTVDQLVLKHLSAALRVARRLTGDAEEAEDVVQEALVRVLARWKTFRGESTFGTWMLQIVVNVALDRRRRRPSLSPPEDIVSLAAGPAEAAAAAELSERIRQLIENMPDRQREVALLSFGEGLPASEVAVILGTTESNVYTCIHLARKRIAEAIGVNLSVRELP